MKRERRREEILRAAFAAFRARGYHATTLEHLADRLHLTKTGLYHYFRDKEAILYACHKAGLDAVEATLRRARVMRAGAPERLRFLIREHVRVLIEALGGSPVALEVAALKAGRAAEVIGRRDTYERGVRAIVAAGIADRSLRPCDPKLAAFAIFGAINWIGRWYDPSGGASAAEVGDAFAQHLVDGLLRRG